MYMGLSKNRTKPGLLMGAGQMLGAFIGSQLVIQKGTGFVRVFFLMVVATIARIAYATYAAQ
jgi:uncharacterized membrane protein YfcA